MRIIRKNIVSAAMLAVTSGVSYAGDGREQAVATGDLALPAYTNEQADQGQSLFKENCASCHGAKLQGGPFAPPLVGDAFYGVWGGKPVGTLLNYVKRVMPPGVRSELTSKDYAQILTHMFRQEGIPAGADKMSDDNAKLSNVFLPIPEGGLIPKEKVPSPPLPVARNNPLDNITPVTDALLTDPPEEDWLMWRRTYDAKGFSPLKQINAGNVKKLSVAWTWSLPEGRNVTTPLVHDGVMFTYANGNIIQALDAKTGDLLWQYKRTMEKNMSVTGMRSIALSGGNVILPAGDGHVVALDMKTGKVVWDQSVVDPSPYLAGGPLAANGKIMLGTASMEIMSGRNFIFALDAKTGEETWRFHTVAMPGEPGGDSWNDLNPEERIGVGAWIPGSYDPETKRAYFGTGNHNTSAAHLRTPNHGATSNDGLYMNSSMVFDSDSGKLSWHHQHLSSDQWCHDEGFERMLLKLPVDGKEKKMMVTIGKQGILDALDVESGSYEFSIDLGLQNIVEAIDPKTGARKIAESAVPQTGKEMFVCPSQHGARNWMPTAFNADNSTLYIPFLDTCMKMRPPKPGDWIMGDMGQIGWPRPDSDGNFGGIWAINLKTRKTTWTDRRRAMPTTGILATAGDLVFNGALDREFAAYQANTGEKLWHARLNSIPSGGPISFMIDGVQYIAVTTGRAAARNIDKFMAPEIVNPTDINSKGVNPTIWVFRLSEG